MIVAGFAAHLGTLALRNYRQAQFFRSLGRDGRTFNPKLPSYSDSVFKVAEMFHPMSHVLTGKTFYNCDFIGPSVIMFDGHVTMMGDGGFHDCGDVIFPPAGTNLTSALVFRNCTFNNCRFFRVGVITSSISVVESLVRGGARDPRNIAPQQIEARANPVPATPVPND